MEHQNINSRWEYRQVEVEYYGFVAIVNDARLKIIVKQIKGGEKYFWSLIPFWKRGHKYSGETLENKKILHVGNLEED